MQPGVYKVHLPIILERGSGNIYRERKTIRVYKRIHKSLKKDYSLPILLLDWSVFCQWASWRTAVSVILLRSLPEPKTFQQDPGSCNRTAPLFDPSSNLLMQLLRCSERFTTCETFTQCMFTRLHKT